MSVSGPGCVKTCASRECAELFSPLSPFDCDCQCCSFPIQGNRDKITTCKFDVGVFTQPGSNSEILVARRCFPLWPQQRTSTWPWLVVVATLCGANVALRVVNLAVHLSDVSLCKERSNGNGTPRGRIPARIHRPSLLSASIFGRPHFQVLTIAPPMQVIFGTIRDTGPYPLEGSSIRD
jgi:hypothetical protein